MYAVAGTLGRGKSFVDNGSLVAPEVQVEGAQTKPPFYLGFATAAPQIEGANATDGRGPSIWDTYAAIPGNIDSGDTSAVADDFYHRYLNDIAAMHLLGVKKFRMSLAWPRILPGGDGQVNDKGINFYGRVIEALLVAEIEPHVTLYHWDLPQALQDRFGGWNSDQIVPIFAEYAATAFKAFGDAVVHWTTFNEPWTFCFLGYGQGSGAPGLNDKVQAWNCVHNVLKAHAAAVKQFRALVPNGKISMNLNCDWAQPLTASPPDKAAAERKMEYMLAAFADPIFKGDYPASVKQRISFLPQITAQMAADLKGSVDYFALNHYTSTYVADKEGAIGLQGPCDYSETQVDLAGKLIGAEAESDWLKVTPWGFRLMLNWVNDRYQPKEIIVTENGMSMKGEDAMPMPQALQDTQRVNFYRDYIAAATEAVTIDKVPMTGYFAWSLLDNFEWGSGYKKRFGVVHVDFTTQQRYYKASAKYLVTLFKCTLLDPTFTYPSD
ncbi:beta-glucosidase [Coccomyxa subellipsoidea C-169]|uniref:beta-glucosidase n=1 Tax=Coccomyxa subellipsoidea (strain C-169) TaxID=574566 RepID=I0ZAH0_COCSC|nr:beta-glucosidase [Coccomyxa subellipsoidea C-169]EIE27639.1 beta-glucosidase [Coccomyxa subellipsoidea C-169]|eukprot:XP_005652183.1 beta-glucosidase [Coccomyxa subellipsoidea C-169]